MDTQGTCGDVDEKPVSSTCCSAGDEPDDGLEVYQSCGSEIEEDVDETTHLTVQVKLPEGTSERIENAGANASTNIETAPQANSNTEPNNNIEAVDCEDDLMPEEQLDSDNSDTAGLYEVNPRDRVEAQNQAYQPGQLPSSSSDSFEDDSDDDDSDMQLPRWRGTLSTSSASPNSSDTDSDSSSAGTNIRRPQIDLSKVKVTKSLFNDVQNRMYGNLGRQQHHTCYTDHLMSNLKFARRMKIVKKLDSHDGCVNALNFNQAGNWLASGSDDTKCVIWDMSTHNPYLKFKTGHHQNVFQCKFMPHSNDSQIVTCARDGMVRLAELSATGACRGTKKLAKHEGSAHKLAIEMDTQHCLLSAGEDGLVYQIDLREKKPTKIVATKEQRRHIPLHSINKNPSNPYEFITSGREHYIRVYDKRKIPEGIFMPEVKKYVPTTFTDSDSRIRDVTCAVYNHNGTEILGTYNDDDIFLFENTQTDGEGYVKTYEGHRNSQTVKGVNFYGPNSEYIVSGSDCGHVFLWDKSSEQIVQLQKADVGGVVNVLEPHPQFPFLAVSGLDHDVKLLMPIAEKPIDMKRHCRSIKRNIRQRSNSSSRHPEEVDGHLFWTIMRHLESRRRRAAHDAADDLDADDADDDSMDTDSDDEPDSDQRQALSSAGCVTS